MEQFWRRLGLGGSQVGDISEQTGSIEENKSNNKFWTYKHEGKIFQFYQPDTEIVDIKKSPVQELLDEWRETAAQGETERNGVPGDGNSPSSESNGLHSKKIKKITVQELLDGWRKTAAQGQKEGNGVPGDGNSPNGLYTKKLIISVYGWNSKDYDFRYKHSHVSLMAEDLVRMVANTGSLLTFQGTEGNAVFSALGQALTDHEGASFMAVINHDRPHSPDSNFTNNDHVKTCCSSLIRGKKCSLQSTESDGYQDKPSCFCFKPENKDKSESDGRKFSLYGEHDNLEEEKRRALSEAIVKSHKRMEKYIICENIVDICGPEDVCECTVVINGDIQQIKTVIKNSVEKKRPVILVKGLGKVMDDLAVLVQKKKCGKDKDVVGENDLKKFVEELSEEEMELLQVYDVDYDRSAGKNTLPSTSKNADSDSESIEGKILSALAKRFKKVEKDVCECTVVINGEMQEIKTVIKNSVAKKRPVILVKGLGKVMDDLSVLVQKKKCGKDKDVVGEKYLKEFVEELSEEMELLHVYDVDYDGSAGKNTLLSTSKNADSDSESFEGILSALAKRFKKDVCECTVVINGDMQEIKTVIKNSVAKKRPVILVKGLGKVMDDLAVLVQKKKCGKDKDVVGEKYLKEFVEELSEEMELLQVYDLDYVRSAGKNTLPSASKNADSDSESFEGILSALAKRFKKDVCECTVVINGDMQEIKTVIKNSVAKKRPVILVKGLGKVMDDLAVLVQKKKCGKDKDVVGEKYLKEFVEELSEKMELLQVYDIDYVRSAGKNTLPSASKNADSDSESFEGILSALAKRFKKDVCECTVVINGDMQEIKTVIKNSVAKKRPVILVKGLGKVMDDLAVLVQKKKCGKDKDVVGEEMELLHVYDVDYDRSSGKNTLPSASKNADSGSKSIEGKILSALAKRFEEDKRHRKLLLEMCIECNEFDVAERGGLLPEKGEVLEKETLVKALDCGGEKFVHHFLNPQLNFDTDKQITEADLDTLYGGYFSKRRHHSKSDKERTSKSDKERTSKSDKERTSKSDKERTSKSDKERTSKSDKERTLKKEVNKLIPTVYLRSKGKNDGENQKNTNMLDGEDLTRRNIFIYAVLTEKYELAKVMLGHVHQHTPAALLACGLLKAKAKKTDKYLNKHQEYKEKSCEFGQLAEDSISREYEKFRIRTFRFLRRKMEAWGNVSLTFLARETKDKSFLMLEPCYCLQEAVWWFGDKAVDVLEGQTQEQFKINRTGIFSLFPPMVMCYFNFLGLILFLMGFALLLVSKLETEKFHFLEWIVLATVITFILQELEQLHMKFKDLQELRDEVKNNWKKIYPFFKVIRTTWLKYIHDYFNKIDSISVLVYVVAFGLRVDAYYKPGDTDRMDAARAFFSISFAVFMLRLLRFCYIHKSLARMVLMITSMFKILLKFLVILVIFVVAYAVASEAVLYPESKMSWALVFHVLRKPYWSMYGELFLDELEADGSDHCTVCTTDPNLYDTYDELRCASKTGRYIVPVFQGIYVLIVNILLFNLLIALFSSAVQKVETRSKALWSFQRSVILREYSRYMLPFPFTGLTLFLLGRPMDPFSYFKKSPLHVEELNSMERQTRHHQEEEDKRESQLHLMGIAKTVNNEKIQIHLPHLNCMSPESSTSKETQSMSETEDSTTVLSTGTDNLQGPKSSTSKSTQTSQVKKSSTRDVSTETDDTQSLKSSTSKKTETSPVKKHSTREVSKGTDDSQGPESFALSRNQDQRYRPEQKKYLGTIESEDDPPGGNKELPRPPSSKSGKKKGAQEVKPTKTQIVYPEESGDEPLGDNAELPRPQSSTSGKKTRQKSKQRRHGYPEDTSHSE